MSTIAQIKIKELTVRDLAALLTNNGYETGVREFAFAHNNDLYGFAGPIEGGFRYVIACEDHEREGVMFVTFILVHFDCETGNIVAVYAAMPILESNSLESITNAIKEHTIK